MLAYVLDIVTQYAEASRVIVAAQDYEELCQNVDIAAFRDAVEWRTSQGTIAETVNALLDSFSEPLLVTTADNVLLTQQILAEFQEHSKGSDIAVAAVSKSNVAQSNLSTKRTWLKLRGDSWSGSNLFYLGGPEVLPLVKTWAGIEQSRKKALSFFSAFGPAILLRFLLRSMTIDDFGKLLSQRFKIKAKIVALSDAHACIDADKLEDVTLIESVLCDRQK